MLSSNPCWLIIWVGLIFFCNMEAQYLDRFENHIAIAITIHMTLIETVSLYKCLELCVRFRRENFKNWKKYQRKVWMTHISFEDRLSGMHKVFLMLPTYLTRHSTYRQENKWQKWNFLSLIFLFKIVVVILELPNKSAKPINQTLIDWFRTSWLCWLACQSKKAPMIFSIVTGQDYML